jgi:hypothetical protein
MLSEESCWTCLSFEDQPPVEQRLKNKTNPPPISGNNTFRQGQSFGS